jgi:transposase-like protein
MWCAVDQHGVVLDVLVQSRRDKKAAKRLLRKLLTLFHPASGAVRVKGITSPGSRITAGSDSVVR